MEQAQTLAQHFHFVARMRRRELVGTTQRGQPLNTIKDVAVWLIKRQPYYGDRTAADESAELPRYPARTAG